VGRAREVADAEQQVIDESWQCRTCDAPAEVGGAHCMTCRMYWDDVAAGVFDRDDERDAAVSDEVFRQIMATSDADVLAGNWPPLVRSVLQDDNE